MELIANEEDRQTAPLAEPEPRYRPEVVERTQDGQAWLRLALSILAGIILIILIVLFARWIYHKSHHNVQPAPSVSQNTPAESSNNSNASGAQPSGNSTSPPNNSSSGSSAATNTTNPQITNTGPGDVAAIFVGASLVAGGLHYLISLRRFNKFDAKV